MPPLPHLARVFLRIGLLSFGGPAAQIALMQRVLVDEEGWLNERTYLDALAFCMLLPGPEALQVATYSGWRVRGIYGGLIAGGLFILPGALLMLALAALYTTYAHAPAFQAAFLGIKAAVLVIVFQALRQLSAKTLRSVLSWALALLSFLLLAFGSVPFPLIVLGAGLLGYGLLSDKAEANRTSRAASGVTSLLILALGTLLWLAPLALVQGILLDLTWFFTRLAAVSFGGAYAGLSYMAQDLAQTLGVVSQAQMVDGLGLAETTPGPLILVTQFMAYIAADAGGVSGLSGALLALWAIFVPSFVLIFALAPHLDMIRAHPRLRGALSGISAAVVGVIAALSLWFALSVFFGEVARSRWGWMQTYEVTLANFQGRAAGLLAFSSLVLLGLRWPYPWVLLFSALGGLVLSYAF